MGKTSITTAVAHRTGFGVITNDTDSSIDEVLGKKRVLRVTNNQKLPEINEGY